MFYTNLHSFITCGWSAKKLSLLIISHKLLAITKRFPLPYVLPDLPNLPDSSQIAPLFIPDCSLIAPQLNYASAYTPVFDTIEWMKMHTSLPISGLLRMCFLSLFCSGHHDQIACSLLGGFSKPRTTATQSLYSVLR